MICILALITFSILGIFSASHRRFARMAFDCVARKLTLRPCEVAFDRQVKMKLVARLSGRSMRMARFTNKNFQAISWAFTILLFVSLFFTASGLYNLAVYGSCDPHSEVCYLNPAAGTGCGSEHCETEGCDCGINEIGCTEENNFEACEGNCDCIKEVCG